MIGDAAGDATVRAQECRSRGTLCARVFRYAIARGISRIWKIFSWNVLRTNTTGKRGVGGERGWAYIRKVRRARIFLRGFYECENVYALSPFCREIY